MSASTSMDSTSGPASPYRDGSNEALICKMFYGPPSSENVAGESTIQDRFSKLVFRVFEDLQCCSNSDLGLFDNSEDRVVNLMSDNLTEVSLLLNRSEDEIVGAFFTWKHPLNESIAPNRTTITATLMFPVSTERSRELFMNKRVEESVNRVLDSRGNFNPPLRIEEGENITVSNILCAGDELPESDCDEVNHCIHSTTITIEGPSI